MLVNIEKFLIINQSTFNKIIADLNCNLTIDDKAYLATYILVNIFAYMVVIITLYVIKFMYYELFKQKKL